MFRYHRLPAVLAVLLLGLPWGVLAEEKSGQMVYDQTCIVCHHAGRLGAPKLADGKRWRHLVAEGLDDLVPAALGGLRQMPARGGNPNLSDGEVARAVVWMVNQHGAQAAEPDEAAIKRWRAMADRQKKR
ncbi:MAG: c-type cytochrome [Dechloromonas sp.]|nr:c-type cytochrome [Dechloromonas sp.]